jgi:hypothetical protein
MNHIGPNRTPYVNGFSCLSTLASAWPASRRRLTVPVGSAAWCTTCLGFAIGGKSLLVIGGNQ